MINVIVSALRSILYFLLRIMALAPFGPEYLKGCCAAVLFLDSPLRRYLQRGRT